MVRPKAPGKARINRSATVSQASSQVADLPVVVLLKFPKAIAQEFDHRRRLAKKKLPRTKWLRDMVTAWMAAYPDHVDPEEVARAATTGADAFDAELALALGKGSQVSTSTPLPMKLLPAPGVSSFQIPEPTAAASPFPLGRSMGDGAAVENERLRTEAVRLRADLDRLRAVNGELRGAIAAIAGDLSEAQDIMNRVSRLMADSL